MRLKQPGWLCRQRRNPTRPHRWRRFVLLAVAACCLATGVEAQFGFRRLMRPRLATVEDFDSGFHFCRIVYRSAPNGAGGNWTTDYPRADINMSIRLGELTRTNVSTDRSGRPNHLLVRLTDDELFLCPFVMMAAPGRVWIGDDEAERLREYLLKGGFLWTDDFWGSYEWDQWVRQLYKVLPANEYPILDLTIDHPLLQTQFAVSEIPQIPSINFFFRSGGRTSERGAESAVPHARAVADRDGRVMVLMTHNTDISDSWEREADDPRYFYNFSPTGYAFGINALLYAMTH